MSNAELRVLLALGTGLALPVMAGDVFDLSLEELMQLEVSVASRHNEPLANAPGTVTAWSRADMDRLGYSTLADLAGITAGYGGYSIYGEQVFSTRGQKAGSFNNNKHLLLIDDIPFVHARARKVPIEEELPLHFARQVEFLKGPASALYGTGAFYGVVSVDPKNMADSGDGSIWSVRMADVQQGISVRGSSVHDNAPGESLLALSYYSRQSSNAPVGVPAKPLQKFYDDQDSLFLFARQQVKDGVAKGLTLGTIFSRKAGGLGEHWMGDFSHPSDELIWTTFVPYLKYERELNADLNLKMRISHNVSSEQGTWAIFSASSWAAYNGSSNPLSIYKSVIASDEAQAELHWHVADNRSAIVGLAGDRRRGQDSSGPFSYESSSTPGVPLPGGTGSTLFGENISIHTQAVYGQWRQQIPQWHDFDITAGLRYDSSSSGSDHFSRLSPRLALMQPLGPQSESSQHNLKLMYGTALRAPGMKEYGLNTEAYDDALAQGITLGNLSPEVFRTTELSWTRADGGRLQRATLFYNETDDVLDCSGRSGVNFCFSSQGRIKARGMELELSQQLAERHRLGGHISIAGAEDPAGNDLPDVPSASAALIYNLQGGHDDSHTLIVQHLHGWRAPVGIKRSEGYTRLDYTLNWRLERGLELNLECRNLTDEGDWYPKSGVPDVPLPGRSIWFGLTLHQGASE